MVAFLLATPVQAATASYYRQGTKTASGERFNPNGMTCAHKTARFGTHFRVSHNGRAITCRVNDRGPFKKGRDIDLSRGAARQLGILGKGVAAVTLHRI